MGTTILIVGILVLLGAGIAFGIITMVSKRTKTTDDTLSTPSKPGSTRTGTSFFDNIQLAVGSNASPDAASLTLAPPVPTTEQGSVARQHDPSLIGAVDTGVTAYMPAFLLAGKEGEDRYFRGVGGFGLNAADFGVRETIRVGKPAFYGYRTMKSAQQAARQGNVILEVQLTGELTEDVDGYTAYTLEVIAIHPGTCAICGDPATHFSHDPSFDIVATLCAQHYDKMLDMMAQGEIEVSDQFYPVSIEFKHLHRGVPWVLYEELQIG